MVRNKTISNFEFDPRRQRSEILPCFIREDKHNRLASEGKDRPVYFLRKKSSQIALHTTEDGSEDPNTALIIEPRQISVVL
jgi:hypothetical protein